MKQENQNYDLTKRPAEEVVEPIPEEQLNQEAKLRAKKRPLLEKSSDFSNAKTNPTAKS